MTRMIDKMGWKALCASMLLAGGVLAAENELPKCPVTGEPVDFSVSTSTDHGPVYFCCKGCIKKFKADPASFSKEVAEQRAALAKLDKVQVKCPISGEPIDPKVSIEHHGKKVFFCCPKCIGKFQKDPAKYAKALAASYTYQTKCPITGEEIDPAVFTTLADGRKIYYCCKGCEKKLFGNPVKFLPKLAEQGYPYTPKDLKKKSASDHDDHDHGSHGGHGHGG